MKIKELKTTNSDTDGVQDGDTKYRVDTLLDEGKSNVFNTGICDFSIPMTSAISKFTNLRAIENRGDILITKSVHAEWLILGARIFNELKVTLLKLTEQHKKNSLHSGKFVFQSLRTNSKPTVLSNESEQAELRKIGDATLISVANDVIPAPVGYIYASASHPQPKDEEKLNQLILASSSSDSNVHKVSEGDNDVINKKDSIINTVVSNSITSIQIDKNGEKMSSIKSVDSSLINEDTDSSSESMFYITKDSEDDTLFSYDAKIRESKQIIYDQFKLLQLEEGLKAVNELQKKLVKTSNRFFDKDPSELVEVINRDNKSAGDNFDVLSTLTDNKISDNDKKTIMKKNIDYDDTEHELSFTPNGQSTALRKNGNELLSTISMLQAALEKARPTLDDCVSSKDYTTDESIDVSKKSAQASIESLDEFSNEWISDGIFNEYSPLRKTAFGETSYMRETKARVVPNHFKKLFKRVKELMHVVVDKGVSVSTPLQNTKKQTTLIKCSQENYHTELCSKPDSNFNFGKLYSHSSTKAFRNLDSISSVFDETNSQTKNSSTHAPVEQSSMAEVLVFDHQNPLNNILLHPLNRINTEGHRYNPIKTAEKPRYCKHNHATYNDTSRNHTSRQLNVFTVAVNQPQFAPNTAAEETNQKFRFSSPYSIHTEEQVAKAKLTEDVLQNILNSNLNANIRKANKRSVISSKNKCRQHSCIGNSEMKMQKTVTGPKVKFKIPIESSPTGEPSHNLILVKHKMQGANRKAHSSKIRNKKLQKTKVTKPGRNTNERQLIADYADFDTGLKHNNDYNNKKTLYNAHFNLHTKIESVISFSQSNVSFSSSKNLNPKNDILSTNVDRQSLNQSTMEEMPSQVSWHPEPRLPKLLVFDYLNSLNNVLLTPIDHTEAHKNTYNPIKSNKMICDSEHSHSRSTENQQGSTSDITKDFEVRTITTKRHQVAAQWTSTQEEDQVHSQSVNKEKEEQATEIISVSKTSEIILQAHSTTNSHVHIPKEEKWITSPPTDKNRHLSFMEVTPKCMANKQITSYCPKVQKRRRKARARALAYKLGTCAQTM